MDRYQKVEKPKTETAISENELRITAQGRLRNYISYAISLLEEKGANEVVLKATGRAINKTVMIAELLKRRVVGLHQNTSTGSIDITDVWEPLEEGLLPLETTRHVSAITITLSRKELDSSSLGYQPPVPTDQVKPLADYDDGRVPEYNNGHWDGGAGYGGRGRGRAAGRSFWGHGRRYDGNMQQESEYYNGYGGSGALPPQGRGNCLLAFSCSYSLSFILAKQLHGVDKFVFLLFYYFCGLLFVYLPFPFFFFNFTIATKKINS
ncbi:Alba domain-containing protein [Citrus sinensis]|nr:Alba domain-containing protein [Citrus sinensis]